MSAIFHVCAAMPESERNARIYAGEILVFRGFDAVGDLVQVLRAHCRNHLGDDPERVHQRMTPAQLERAADALREAVRKDKVVAQRCNDAFRAIGMDVQATYGDGIVARVQTVRNSRRESRALSPLAPHRDTWGSNIAAQTNWWAPTFATTPERTIALFPAYFERVVANDSAGWDFAELLRQFRTAEPDYPLLPLATERPPASDALAISLLPGDLMCFSGAHLHASVPNTTDLTRLSFETRTVNGGDVGAGRGAPDVDGRAVRATYQLFRRLTDHREKLGEMGEHRRNPQGSPPPG